MTSDRINNGKRIALEGVARPVGLVIFGDHAELAFRSDDGDPLAVGATIEDDGATWRVVKHEEKRKPNMHWHRLERVGSE